MGELDEVTYKVLLVFPGFGEGRENAAQILEEALHYLNTQKDEPGMRFAPQVTAQLETVSDAEDARAQLRTNDDLAMMILHDLPKDEQAALTRACTRKGVPVCHTLESKDEPRQPPRASRTRPRQWHVVFRERSDAEPPAHRISERVLTAPLDGDPDDLADRLGQAITVLALGVMEHHWRQNPPQDTIEE